MMPGTKVMQLFSNNFITSEPGIFFCA